MPNTQQTTVSFGASVETLHRLKLILGLLPARSCVMIRPLLPCGQNGPREIQLALKLVL
jgi:hypothetical protein